MTFTDEATLSNSPPQLYLNINRFASYAGGSGGKTYKFVYYTSEKDNTTMINAAIYPKSNSTILCPNSTDVSCILTNKLGKRVKTSVLAPSSVIAKSNVSVYTKPPKIVDVWSDKVSATYDSDYTVGEQINIYVKYDRSLIILGFPPQLRMQVNTITPSYASYVSSDKNILTFSFVVPVGAKTANLTYDGPSAFVLSPSTKFYRESVIPTTEASYVLPTPRPLARNGNTISINSLVIPRVISVTPVNKNGRYAPGDIIILRLVFSHTVVVFGTPYLNLNVGGQIAVAPYTGLLPNSTTAPRKSPPSRYFYFSYRVATGHFSPDLDYIDKFSFFTGLTFVGGQGTILHQSTTPTTQCNLDLPLPGTLGSISFSSQIYIDGAPPFVNDLSFVTQAGVYNELTPITIRMNFSAPVTVIGIPTIKMQTGTVNQLAYYTSGSGSNSLIFVYNPQVGDLAPVLDYFSDRSNLLSAQASFQLNGGSIKATSANPILNASIFLNPPGGDLFGQTQETSTAGIVTFKDLAILRRGLDYTILFSAMPTGSNRLLTATQTVFVSFSMEYAIRPSEALQGDMIGYSSAIQNDISILGAPNSNLSVYDVQIVTTRAENVRDNVMEVQQVGVYVCMCLCVCLYL